MGQQGALDDVSSPGAGFVPRLVAAAGTAAQPDASVPPAEVDITVVVPFFNPGPRLFGTVEQAVEVLRSTGATFEVVAVSDGSTDGSEATLETLLSEDVSCIVLPQQGGKGQALRAGLSRGRGRYLGFIDGDGDVPPQLLAEFVKIVRTERPDAVVGSKRHPDAEVVYPLARRLYSWGYQQLVKVLFDLNVRDTQAGIKLVRRDVLDAVLPRLVEQRFAFDLEMLVVARHLGFTDIVEAPVRIRERFSSTISLRAVGAIFRDTMAIFWRLRFRHRYDRPPVAPPAAD